MTVVVQAKRKTTLYAVPAGGEILWFGIAANVPSGFAIDSYCANVFVRGCAAGGASNTQAGNASHQHTNPAATGSQAAHSHSFSGSSTSAASGTTEVYQTNNENSAPPSHTHSIGSGTSGTGGAHSHTLSATVEAEGYPPYARLYWIKAIAETALPVGGIVMWDDVIANVPSGFSLCNGSGATVDLRDKFVYGAAADEDIGDAGGAETHTHSNVDASASGSHSHSLSKTSGTASSNRNVSGYDGGTTVAAGGHTHSLSGTSDADANHTHTLSATGAGASLPPYLMLYFIQRES